MRYQEVRIQELPDQVPIGHIPRAMTVQCRAGLTRQCSPGEHRVHAFSLSPSDRTCVCVDLLLLWTEAVPPYFLRCCALRRLLHAGIAGKRMGHTETLKRRELVESVAFVALGSSDLTFGGTSGLYSH